MSIKKYCIVLCAFVFITIALYGNSKDLPAPNNFTVFADTMRIGISWDPPNSSGNNLLRYNLYREGVGKYYIFDEMPDTTFYDYSIHVEEYTYWITAVYVEGESVPSNIESTIPFREYGKWEEDFSTDWVNTGWREIPSTSNWQWQSGDGGYAQLSGQPSVENYNTSLISPSIDVSNLYSHSNLEIEMFIDNKSISDGEVWEIWIVDSAGEYLLWTYDDPSQNWGEVGGTTIVFEDLQLYHGNVNIKFRSHGGSTDNFESWNIYNVKYSYAITYDYAMIDGFVHDYFYNPLGNVRIQMQGERSYYTLSNENGSFGFELVGDACYEPDYYLPGYSSSVNSYVCYISSGIYDMNINYGCPVLVIEPDSILQYINIGDTTSVALRINNYDGRDSLLWSVSIKNNSSPDINWITLSDSSGGISQGQEVELQVYFSAINDTTSIIHTCDLMLQADYETIVAEVSVSFEVTGFAVDDDISDFSEIIQAYPNPFTSSITFSFNLITEHTEKTKIKIYNIKGQLIRELTDYESIKGINEVEWDGKDSNGTNVSSGIYFYQIKCGNEIVATKKCMILRN